MYGSPSKSWFNNVLQEGERIIFSILQQKSYEILLCETT